MRALAVPSQAHQPDKVSSTILKLILGLLKPESGQILVDGEDIMPLDETELERVRDRMGMVFQEAALFDCLSVYENVAYRLHEHEMPEEDIEQEVRSILQLTISRGHVDLKGPKRGH